MSLLKVELHCADDGACGFYRMAWPGYAVHNAGLADVTVLMPTKDWTASVNIIAIDNKIVGLGKGREEPWPDVMVFQRPLKNALAQTIPFLREQGVEVVVELDDNFHTVSSRNAAWSMSKDRAKNLTLACENASLVTVATEALAEQYGGHGRVKIISNYVPARYLDINDEREDAKLRLGWAGSVATHPDDLQVVGNAVAVALRAHPSWSLGVVGTGVGIARRFGISKFHEAYNTGWVALDAYPHCLNMLDVGLVPLEHSVFNECKSWLKGLEYAAVGVPFIATPTTEYKNLHDKGLGRLADSPAEWRHMLSVLMKDDGTRQEEAIRQRAIVRAGLTIEANVNQWSDAWHLAAQKVGSASGPIQPRGAVPVGLLDRVGGASLQTG